VFFHSKYSILLEQEKHRGKNTQKYYAVKFFTKNQKSKHHAHNPFFREFGGCIFIFGHFINVQFSKQPINNDSLPKTFKSYCFSYLKKNKTTYPPWFPLPRYE